MGRRCRTARAGAVPVDGARGAAEAGEVAIHADIAVSVKAGRWTGRVCRRRRGPAEQRERPRSAPGRVWRRNRVVAASQGKAASPVDVAVTAYRRIDRVPASLTASVSHHLNPGTDSDCADTGVWRSLIKWVRRRSPVLSPTARWGPTDPIVEHASMHHRRLDDGAAKVKNQPCTSLCVCSPGGVFIR